MNRLTIQYCLIITLLTGCGKASIQPNDGPQQITFDAFIVENGKAYPIRDTRALGGDLAAGYMLTGVFTSKDYIVGNNTANQHPAGELENNRLFWGAYVAQNGSYGGGSRFWNMNGTARHTFFAYSAQPTGSQAGTGVSRLGGLINNHPVPYINFTQNNDPAKQIDFLVADPVPNLKAYPFAVPKVNLYFKHALSRLIFKLMGTGKTTLTECRAQVTYNTNAVGSYVDAMMMPITDYYNTAAPWHSGTYNLGGMFTLPASASDSRTAVTVGEMILIPKANLPDEFLTVTITYKDASGASKSAAMKLPSMSLQSQRQYILLLNIIETTEQLTIASVTLEPWQKIEDTVDELN